MFEHAFASDAAREASAFLVNRGSSIGRQRALRTLRRVFPAKFEFYDAESRVAIWSHLVPRESVILTPQDPGQKQGSVTVEYLVVGDLPGCNMNAGLWTLEIPDHALHRLVERDRHADLYDTLFDAHKNLLAVRLDEGRTSNIYLRAGRGAFAGEFIFANDISDLRPIYRSIIMYFRPRTWLHEDQLGKGQDPLLFGEPRLGAGPLLPMPLRQLDINGRNLVVRSILGKVA